MRAMTWRVGRLCGSRSSSVQNRIPGTWLGDAPLCILVAFSSQQKQLITRQRKATDGREELYVPRYIHGCSRMRVSDRFTVVNLKENCAIGVSTQHLRKGW